MADPVKAKRRYDSPRRREQAAATRREILEAAERLFTRDGYGATTMAAIAAEARVALKTVYVAFENKSGVLRALWNLRLRGERDELPVAQQQWYLSLMQEPDPERQLRRTAENSRAVKLRIGPVLQIIGEAAPIDPDIAALWSRIQTEFRANQRTIAQSLADKDALEPNTDVERAADILWTINHPYLWRLLVAERGWSPEDYERWCADTLCVQLLRRSGPD
jgi:AcrR family transcriptional regulator